MSDLPVGYFSKVLAIDCETSGINYDNKDDCSDGCQSVSWGMIVADATTFETIEKLYVEIKWDGKSKWNSEAEKIHGLSKKYLNENGVSEEDAVVLMGNLILKYWPLNVPIKTLGHNVQGFDILFLRRLFRKFDMELNFGNRHIDTFSLMNPLLGAYNSEDGFTTMGLPPRKQHNAMEDIEYTLETVRRMSLLWKTKIGIKYKK